MNSFFTSVIYGKTYLLDPILTDDGRWNVRCCEAQPGMSHDQAMNDAILGGQTFQLSEACLMRRDAIDSAREYLTRMARDGDNPSIYGA